MKLYNHLSEKERQRIEFLLTNNHSIRNIAKDIKRAPSTISREINRNTTNKDKGKDRNRNRNRNKDRYKDRNKSNNKYNEYNWFKAQKRSRDIRFKNINNKIQKYPDLQNYIFDKLNKKWSPEQISDRLTPTPLF